MPDMRTSGNAVLLSLVKAKPIVLWAAFLLLPTLVFVAINRDGMFQPRTSIEGMITSKSLQVGTGSYALMRFTLSGAPFSFTGWIGMVSRPTPHPKSTYAAVREGVPAKVTVLVRDLERARGGETDAVPALLVEQNGGDVFIAGEALTAFAAYLLIALTIIELIGLVIDGKKFASDFRRRCFASGADTTGSHMVLRTYCTRRTVLLRRHDRSVTRPMSPGRGMRS